MEVSEKNEEKRTKKQKIGLDRHGAIPTAPRSPFDLFLRRAHRARQELSADARITPKNLVFAKKQPGKGQRIIALSLASTLFALSCQKSPHRDRTHKIISSGLSSPTTFSSAAKSVSEPPPSLPSPPPELPPLAPEHHASEKA